MMSSKYHICFLLMMCCLNGIDGQILSRNRHVYMSSQFTDWSGDRVVDGDYTTIADSCRCCAATITQTDPWITIDLGNTYMITRIRVYGRTDQNNQNLNGLLFKLDNTIFTPTTDSTPTPIHSYTFILDRPTAASNVTLMLPGSSRILVLCEFDVFNDVIISTNKHVTSSSQFSTNWPIQGAVDGDNRTDGIKCQCCAATKEEDNPWLRVDLGGFFYITYIKIYGRTDDNSTKQLFHGLEIESGNGNIIDVPDADNHYDSGAMRVGPATYVKLQINGKGKFLVVCELQVFGECADGYPDPGSSCQTDVIISNNKHVTSSSRFDANWPIQGAVDGDNRTDGNTCQCCAATKEEDNPWLRVDLGGYFYITYIKIYGRTDDNSTKQRFHGLEIEAGNGSIIRVPDTENYYNSGAMRVGPATYVKLQLNGIERLLIVCELQVFGECADGYTDTDTSCQTVCPAGTYGTNCAETCGQCRIGAKCNPIDGVCQQCEDGFSEADKTCKTPCSGGTFGKNCSETCGHCRDGTTCNRTSGACQGCFAGFNETDITCRTRCLGGTYGYNCTETCGECRYGLACNTTNGVCEGCEDGFHETDITCKTPCKYDTYGHNCTGVCGHCKNGTICNKTNGVCDQCEEGYMETDMLCVEVCSNGTYGQNCSKECGHCSGGEVCRQSDGFCSACVDGYMYTEEDTTCKTGAENVSRPSLSCSNPSGCPDIMMIVGVTVATMLAIEGAAVVIIRLIRKRNSLRKDNVGEPNPYELPDRSINEDEHQYDSAMDMSVETPNYVNTDLRAT